MKLIEPVVPCGSVNAVDPVVPVVPVVVSVVPVVVSFAPVVVSVVPVVPVVVSVVPQLQAVVVGIVVIPTAEEVWAHVEEKQSLKSKSMLVFGLNEIVAKMS